jgi:hypothetical protein
MLCDVRVLLIITDRHVEGIPGYRDISKSAYMHIYKYVMFLIRISLSKMSSFMLAYSIPKVGVV